MEEREFSWPQKDLPYEQQMKHIIEHYRWLLDQNDKLARYARKLELRVKELSEKNIMKSAANRRDKERFIEKNREVKRLRFHIEWLKQQFERELESLRQG